MNPEDQPAAEPLHGDGNSDSEDQPMPLVFQRPQRPNPMPLFPGDIPRRRSSLPTYPKFLESHRYEPGEQQMRHMQALYLEQPQHHLRQTNQGLPPRFLPEIPPSRANPDFVQQQQLHQLHQQQLHQHQEQQQQPHPRHRPQQLQNEQQQLHKEKQQLQQQQQQLQQQLQQQPTTSQESHNQQLAPNDGNSNTDPIQPLQHQQPEQQQQEQKQQQQQQQQTEDQQAGAEASTSGGGGAPTTSNTKEEINTVSLCTIGQQTVQEIVSKTQEVTNILKKIAPPTGRRANDMLAEALKSSLDDNIQIIKFLFKRLRNINDRCTEDCQVVPSFEYTDAESLIPMAGDPKEDKFDDRNKTEANRTAEEEREYLLKQVIFSNRRLKEIIDHVRRIVREINTMLGVQSIETSDDD